MIVYKDKALSILKKDCKLPNYWLIFGINSSEVNLFKDKILQKLRSDQNEVVQCDSDFQSIFQVRSLFQQHKVVVLSDMTDGDTTGISDALKSMLADDYLIVIANELKKSSTLRNLFESHESAIALNCYKLDQHAMMLIIEKELKSNSIQYEAAVPAIISNMISYDVIHSELEKIYLFFADVMDKYLTEALLPEIIAMSPEYTLDKLFISIVLKRNKDFINEMQSITINNLNYMMLIRAYQYFLNRIIAVQQQLGQIGIDNATNTLKPPLFGQQRAEFIHAIQNSDLQNNIKLLRGAIQMECEVKTFTALEPILYVSQQMMEQICSR